MKNLVFILVVVALLSSCTLKTDEVNPPTPILDDDFVFEETTTTSIFEEIITETTTETTTEIFIETTIGEITTTEIIEETTITELHEPLENFDYENAEEIDLTTMNSNMVYATIYDMMVSPHGYLGKTITMTGQFIIFEDEETGNIYKSCLIYDAMACCSQGLEFVLENDAVYPDDYPALESEITVTGRLEMYEENGNHYLSLYDAKLL